MTDDLESPESDDAPIRVSEQIVSAYQWDAWRETVLSASRKGEIKAILLGLIVAIAVGALGYDLLEGTQRLSVLIYAPVVGAGVWFWARSWLARRPLRRVIEELRPIVAPALVNHVTDQQLVSMLRHGGAPFSDESIMIVAQRRDAAVALVASEYDMSKYTTYPYAAGG